MPHVWRSFMFGGTIEEPCVWGSLLQRWIQCFFLDCDTALPIELLLSSGWLPCFVADEVETRRFPDRGRTLLA